MYSASSTRSSRPVQRYNLVLEATSFDDPIDPQILILSDEALTRLKFAKCSPKLPAKRCAYSEPDYDDQNCWRPAAKLVDGEPRCNFHVPRIEPLP